VYPVHPGATATDLDRINAELAGRVVLVRLEDGTELLAHDVEISESSVSMRRERFPGASGSWPARDVESMPLSAVDSIEVERRAMGGVQGALFGLAIGAGVGAVAGGSVFEPNDDVSVALGAASFGAVGVPVGFLIGASVGARDVYDLSDATEDVRSRPSAE
jgi:hypothetical protein